jgi:phytoene dehydrogenase-like protein
VYPNSIPAAFPGRCPQNGVTGRGRGSPSPDPRRHRIETVDAIVIGAGHNGLVAGSLLADAGWSVLVLEATDTPGGAIRSAELTRPGWVHDVFSAFYPLAAASPVLAALHLGEHGLRWAHAPAVLGHVLDADHAVVLHRDRAQTARSIATAGTDADAARWLRLCAEWDRIGADVVAALLHPFPPVRAALGVLRGLGPAGTAGFLRRALTPLDRWAGEDFAGEGAPALLTGSAMHTDLGPADIGSWVFGWLLCMLGQQHGFPVPVGGAGQLAAALCRRLSAAGGELRLSAPVAQVVIDRGGAAQGVRLADGTGIRARRAVLADVPAPALYQGLIPADRRPGGLVRAMAKFEPDLPLLKVDWALRCPIPWRAKELAGAGTVHLGGPVAALRNTAAALRAGRLPEQPFVVLGQMTLSDPTRSPTGTETAWAYSHLPNGYGADEQAIARTLAAIEAAVEQAAPGFHTEVLARHVLVPRDLQRLNPSLLGGTMNGGTAAVHQQLVLRPIPGLGRADTPFQRLFLASSSAHPSGGVHGACGSNAARAALAAHGWVGPAYRRAMPAVHRALLP